MCTHAATADQAKKPEGEVPAESVAAAEPAEGSENEEGEESGMLKPKTTVRIT